MDAVWGSGAQGRSGPRGLQVWQQCPGRLLAPCWFGHVWQVLGFVQCPARSRAQDRPVNTCAYGFGLSRVVDHASHSLADQDGTRLCPSPAI